MDKIVTLQLPENFVGQLLDCLEITIEDWYRTKIYYESDCVEVDTDEPYIRECSDEYEAAKIEAFYRKIKDNIERQLLEQS